jgi:hypothetical protein
MYFFFNETSDRQCIHPKLKTEMLFMLCSSVDNQLRIRVTDAALARDIFPQDYHCLGDNENRPIKWLAIESLVHRKFSPASDVVSGQFRQSFGPIEMELECLTFIAMCPVPHSASFREI